MSQIKRYLFSLALVVLCAPALGGCIPMMLAGATAGTTYVVADQYSEARQKQDRAIEREAVRRARTQWEQQQQRALNQDEVIRDQIANSYLSGQLTRVITVHTTVENGVVTLIGNVPDRAVAERAIQLARSTPGVREVRSQLVVVPVRLQPVDENALISRTDQPGEQPIILQPAPNNVPPQAMQPTQQPMPTQPMAEPKPPAKVNVAPSAPTRPARVVSEEPVEVIPPTDLRDTTMERPDPRRPLMTP